jgi:hypothetical protein
MIATKQPPENGVAGEIQTTTGRIAMRTLIATLAVLSTLMAVNVGHAEGFLGGLINQVLPGVGTELDKIHDQMGRPLDHAANQAAGAVVDYVAPGAGQVVTQGLELRDRINRGR